jgi:hypothetical protein
LRLFRKLGSIITAQEGEDTVSKVVQVPEKPDEYTEPLGYHVASQARPPFETTDLTSDDIRDVFDLVEEASGNGC